MQKVVGSWRKLKDNVGSWRMIQQAAGSSSPAAGNCRKQKEAAVQQQADAESFPGSCRKLEEDAVLLQEVLGSCRKLQEDAGRCKKL